MMGTIERDRGKVEAVDREEKMVTIQPREDDDLKRREGEGTETGEERRISQGKKEKKNAHPLRERNENEM